MSESSEDLSILRDLAEGTARTTGDAFFKTMVRKLADTMGTKCALAAEFLGDGKVRSLAYWKIDRFVDAEWDVTGTPCEDVVAGELCHHPTGVMQLFPTDLPLIEMGIQSYLGVPLTEDNGMVLGHLCVFDDKPMPAQPRALSVFRIFAARALAEMERLRVERMLRESEQRFRDLYEQAPIAYVHEDLDSRFISANAAAIRILGLKPEQVPGFVGTSLAPNTPGAQKRIKEAFDSIGRGTDTSGVVLEMTRKDNGQPVWMEWWSKPDPSGKFTRTMFVDITEKVLMEQEQARLKAQNTYLQEEIQSVHNFKEIVGQSPALIEVIDNVNRVAKTDASVLITGETGTGKELVARAIHSASSRHDKPLIKLNCAALPTSLVESELFGHEKGAFSGAIARRVGRFELANGGTIFLDEIGEVPMDVQVKLLRVLQEREFERVGGATPIKSDVRIIAATNRDLPKAIRDGIFRADLFYRLNVFPIHLPPLRLREGDVPLLVQFLVSKFAARVGRRIDAIGHATMQRLQSYRWPGNIRELENVLERAIILSNDPVLEIDPEVFAASSAHAELAPAIGIAALDLESVERNHIEAVLKQSKWVIEGPAGAATVLNMHPNTLRSRMKRLGLSRQTHDRS